MKIRMHRGGFKDSMSTIKDINPNIKEIFSYLKDNGINCKEEDITLKKYTYDERINWDTYVVLVNEMSVAFTDGPI